MTDAISLIFLSLGCRERRLEIEWQWTPNIKKTMGVQNFLAGEAADDRAGSGNELFSGLSRELIRNSNVMWHNGTSLG